MVKQRYIIHEARGGSPQRFIVWDNLEHRDFRGHLHKHEALNVMNSLNGRGLFNFGPTTVTTIKPKKANGLVHWFQQFWAKVKKGVHHVFPM